jgi:hypothetical protein
MNSLLLASVAHLELLVSDLILYQGAIHYLHMFDCSSGPHFLGGALAADRPEKGRASFFNPWMEWPFSGSTPTIFTAGFFSLRNLATPMIEAETSSASAYRA